MPQLAAPLAIASAIFTGISAIRQGNTAMNAAKARAAQLRQRAGQTRAASQRSAIEERRQSRVLQSKAIAAAGASGAGAGDITVVQNVSDIAGYGEYEALTKIYEGEESARGDEYGATMALFEGKQKKKAGLMKGLTSFASAGSTMFDKYGSDLFGSGVPEDFQNAGGGLADNFEDSYAGSSWGTEDYYFGMGNY